MRLYFRDLPSYQNLTEAQKLHPLYSPNLSFNLDRLPAALRNDFAAFIFDRAEALSYLSLRTEAEQFHSLADFITDSCPLLTKLTELPLEDLEHRLKLWILKTGKRLSYTRTRADAGRTYTEDNPVIRYLAKAYRYFLPPVSTDFSKEDDIWDLTKIPIKLRASPANAVSSINFTKIEQPDIRNEIKECCLYRLKRMALNTVMMELSAMNFLSKFLSEYFPEITSLKSMKRELLEEYLSYLYLESKRKKEYRSELYHLKTVFNTIGRLFSYDNLRGIFLKSDFEKRKHTIYRCYSDTELNRLHSGYRYLDKQTARLLIIHELLGLRISDTLTIRKSDLIFGEHPRLFISQQKTGKPFEKKLNPEILSLLSASIHETFSKYGDCEYIFVSDKDPSKPMQYSTLAYRMRTMIANLNLRDDHGKLFTVGTHLFRHTYGKKLCDLLNDDATIAALLGHASLTRMGAEKKSFMDYYLKNRRLIYKYEDVQYSVTILSVDVFPQGYAGVVSFMKDFHKSALVIDIGSWTVDILPINEFVPDQTRCKSLPLGTITCMNEINEALRQNLGQEADETTIKEVMIYGTSDIPSEYLNIIKTGLSIYAANLMDQIRALNFNSDLTQFIFIGGGATIINHFLPAEDKKNALILDDVSINAKGYEGLIRHKMGGKS